MSIDPAPSSPVRFSFSSKKMPAHLTPAKRAALWLDTASNASIKADIDCLDRENFYGSWDTVISGSSVLTKANANCVRIQRKQKHIAQDGNDSLLLLVHENGGPVGGTQYGREVTLNPGQALLLDNKDERSTYTRNNGTALALYISRESTARAGIGIEENAARVLDVRANEALRHMVDYLRVLITAPPISMPALATMTDTYLGDLLTLAFDAGLDAAHLAKSRGLRAVRLYALRQAIVKNAHNQALTAGALSKLLGLSPRYIQHLLYSEGTTLTEEVTSHRLDFANRALRDPEQASLSIAEIAYQSGFSDLSTFYRAFRRKYGMTPGRMRPE